MASNDCERKVYFFQLYVWPADDGSTADFPVVDVLRQIQSLKFLKESTGPKSRYCGEGANITCAWPTISAKGTRLTLGKIRRTDLPLMENAGELSGLPLDRNASIVDSTHIQFFPGGIIGAEFNFYGPRATAFTSYCRDKVPSCPNFHLEPLLHSDAAKQLEELQDIRMLSVKVRASNAELVKAVNKSIPAAFHAMASQFDADEFEIVLRPKPRKTLKQKTIDVAKKLIGATNSPLDDFEKFKVRGLSSESDRVETFDLLMDKFISTKKVVKMPGRTRAIESASMFAAIEKAYNELKTDLTKASKALSL